MPRIRQSGDGGLYFDKQRKLWIGVIDNGYTPEGKRRQVRVTSKSQSIARAKLDRVKGEIKDHGSPLGNQTVAEWGAFWLESMKTKLKPQPYRTYRSVLNTWVLPAIGRRNVKDIRPSDLQRIYSNIRQQGRTSSTALKAHNVMSSMFESARLEQLVSINVTDNIRPPKAARSTRDTFTPDETLRILETAARLPGGTKWIVSLYAGIRQGERLGATLESMDFGTGRFTVSWNLVEANYEHGCGGTCHAKASGHCPDRRLLIPEGMETRMLKGHLMLVPPKSGEPRTFPLPPSLAQALERHVAELTLQPNPYGLLWPARNGDPITSGTDQKEWRALLLEAGIDKPGATTHWARHTAISDFTASGVADRVIGEIVGHKSAGVTGRYQHVSSQDALEAMGKLGDRRKPPQLG